MERYESERNCSWDRKAETRRNRTVCVSVSVIRLACTVFFKLRNHCNFHFSEFKQKLNSTDNHTEDSVSYNFRSTYIFSPELSFPLSGNEVVTILNAVITVRQSKFELKKKKFMKVSHDESLESSK